MDMRERIKAVRKHVGMTQAEFAASLGLGPYGTANWEKRDAQTPTESMQLLICKTFGISKRWLESGEGDMLAEGTSFIDQLVEQHHLSPLDRSFLETFMQLDEEQRRVVLTVARSLASDISKE